jgi:hypothetical protein
MRQLVECVGVEIYVVGPGDGSRLMINVHLGEKGRITQGGEDGIVGPMEPPAAVYDSSRPVTKGQPETVRRKYFNALYARVHGVHPNAVMFASGLPSRARCQFSNSSAGAE